MRFRRRFRRIRRIARGRRAFRGRRGRRSFGRRRFSPRTGIRVGFRM